MTALQRPTCFNNHQIEHREVLADNAAADRLAPALALPAAKAPEAAVARLHQQLHAPRHQHTLLHGEALLILPAHDLEHVALELLRER